jgi:hypothetical protein
MKDYAAPVIGHVFPDQSTLRQETQSWAESLSAEVAPDAADRVAVVVAMPREGDPQSLRDGRIDAILCGLVAAGLSPQLEEVPDYSAGNAATIVAKWPAAHCHVCLSDEIAVSLAQLLAARGRPSNERVLGFDGSGIVGHAAIPSFYQSIDAIGDAVWGLFESFFRRPDHRRWSGFETRPVPLKLMNWHPHRIGAATPTTG